ncbi:hypothetical protein OAD79_00080 [Flavobacteriales bacterium]|nr:hypothetical protein [Flavobacteriales bacterium]
MSSVKLKSDPTKTVLIITVGIQIIYFTTLWEPALFISLILGLTGVISKYLAIKIDFLWMKLTWILSLIIPNLLLSIIYYMILSPIALLSKLFSKRNELFLKNTISSTFKNYNKTFNRESFKNPW